MKILKRKIYYLLLIVTILSNNSIALASSIDSLNLSELIKNNNTLWISDYFFFNTTNISNYDECVFFLNRNYSKEGYKNSITKEDLLKIKNIRYDKTLTSYLCDSSFNNFINNFFPNAERLMINYKNIISIINPKCFLTQSSINHIQIKFSVNYFPIITPIDFKYITNIKKLKKIDFINAPLQSIFNTVLLNKNIELSFYEYEQYPFFILNDKQKKIDFNFFDYSLYIDKIPNQLEGLQKEKKYQIMNEIQNFDSLFIETIIPPAYKVVNNNSFQCFNYTKQNNIQSYYQSSINTNNSYRRTDYIIGKSMIDKEKYTIYKNIFAYVEQDSLKYINIDSIFDSLPPYKINTELFKYIINNKHQNYLNQYGGEKIIQYPFVINDIQCVIKDTYIENPHSKNNKNEKLKESTIYLFSKTQALKTTKKFDLEFDEDLELTIENTWQVYDTTNQTLITIEFQNNNYYNHTFSLSNFDKNNYTIKMDDKDGVWVTSLNKNGQCNAIFYFTSNFFVIWDSNKNLIEYLSPKGRYSIKDDSIKHKEQIKYNELLKNY